MSSKQFIEELKGALSRVPEEELANVTEQIVRRVRNDNKIIIAGNGGSAAIASHLAIDFTKAANVRAISLNDASLITCFANDFGYEDWVKMGIEYYALEGDFVLLVSSSGNSPNIVNAARYAKEKGLYVVTLSGFSPENKLRTIGNINLWVNSSNYNIVETCHLTWLLAVVEEMISLKKE